MARVRRSLAGVAAGPVAVVVCLGLLVSVPAAVARAAAAGGGTWGTAQEVPGSAALNQGGNAEVESLSCAAVGNCSGGGYYTDGHGLLQAFVVGETNGTWGTARKFPGTAVLNQGGNAVVEAVSCTSAGNCSAGGYYVDAAGALQVFVVGETNGVWGTARKVPGIAAL